MADKLYNLILWPDPVNQVSYIQLALRSTFDFDADEAEQHIEEVTIAGRTVLACDVGAHIERDLCALRRFGLSATMEVAP